MGKVNRRERKARRLAYEKELFIAIMPVFEKQLLSLTQDPESTMSLTEFDARLKIAAKTVPWFLLTRMSDLSMLRRIATDIQKGLNQSIERANEWYEREFYTDS